MKKNKQDKSFDLLKKALLTVALLLIYRFGSFVPVPSIDVARLSEITKYTQNGIFGMFNMLSGGSLSRMSIFALSIVPYITSSIIIQLLTSSVKFLKALKDEGEAGQRQIHQYTRYLAIAIAFFQGFAIASGIGKMEMYLGDIPNGTMYQHVMIAITLATGTLFLTWIGEQITSRGIGNGISLMIFAGIVADFPRTFYSMFFLASTGAISPLTLIFLLVVFVANIVAIIIFEKSNFVIKIQQSRNISSFGANRVSSGFGQLPLKINPSGVIPPIFAGSVLLLPTTILSFAVGSENTLIQFLQMHLVHGKLFFIIVYVALIYFFTFFYTDIVFNTKDTADNLRKSNILIPGVRPGQNTADYLHSAMKSLCFIGGSYIAIVCIVPEIMSSVYSQFYVIGGTGLLIMVNVAADTVAQIQMHMLSSKYEKVFQKR